MLVRIRKEKRREETGRALTSYLSSMQVGTGRFDFFYDCCVHPGNSFPSGSSSQPPETCPPFHHLCQVSGHCYSPRTSNCLLVLWVYCCAGLACRLHCMNLLQERERVNMNSCRIYGQEEDEFILSPLYWTVHKLTESLSMDSWDVQSPCPNKAECTLAGATGNCPSSTQESNASHVAGPPIPEAEPWEGDLQVTLADVKQDSCQSSASVGRGNETTNIRKGPCSNTKRHSSSLRFSTRGTCVLTRLL